MVSYEEGIFEGFVPGALEKIRNLRSFHSMEVYVKTGHEIHKTVDLITSPGCIQLIHDELNVIEEDYQFIHNLESKIGNLYQIRRNVGGGVFRNERKVTNMMEVDTTKMMQNNNKELCEQKNSYGDDEVLDKPL